MSDLISDWISDWHNWKWVRCSGPAEFGPEGCPACEIKRLTAEVERYKRLFTHGGVDRFWCVWDEVGEPHIHGVYESTWMAFRRALDGEE